MRIPFWHAAMAVAMLAWSLPSSAALVGRDLDGNLTTFEAYYDTVLNSTWLANANAGAGSSYDNGSSTSDGRMTWSNANTWATSLNPYGRGITGWRLPTVTDTGTSGCNLSYAGGTDCGYNVQTYSAGPPPTTYSEMAHLFYNTLGNLAYCPPGNATCWGAGVPQPGWGLTNTGPFSNVQSYDYWSGTVYAPDPRYAWYFSFLDGYQLIAGQNFEFHAWAVRSGDVGAAAPVPVPQPPAAWLLLSGLVGLAAFRRRGAA